MIVSLIWLVMFIWIRWVYFQLFQEKAILTEVQDQIEEDPCWLPLEKASQVLEWFASLKRMTWNQQPNLAQLTMNYYQITLLLLLHCYLHLKLKFYKILKNLQWFKKKYKQTKPPKWQNVENHIIIKYLEL